MLGFSFNWFPWRSDPNKENVQLPVIDPPYVQVTEEKDLSNRELDEAIVKREVGTPEMINRLVLHGCKCGMGTNALKPLYQCHSITYLDFSEVARCGAKELAEFLVNTPYLTYLNLQHSIHERHLPLMQAIAKMKGLLFLNLSYNDGVDDASLEALRPVTTLTSLDISHNLHVTDVGLRTLQNKTVLISLNLNNFHSTTEKGMRITLIALTHLKELSLQRNCLTDVRSILHALTELEKLDLAKNRISAQHLTFSNLPRLRYLNLQDCKKVDDTILPELVPLSERGVEINLEGCSITHAAFQASGIRATPPQWPSLPVLESAYQARESVTSLDFTGCTDLRDDDIVKLVKACPRLTELRLSGCTGLTPKFVASIVTLSNLQVLYLDNAVPLITNELESLTRLSRLTTLNINGVQAQNWHVQKILEGLKATLQALYLKDCPITDELFKLDVWRECKSLHTLCLERCHITDEGFWNLLQRHSGFTTLLLGDLLNPLTFISFQYIIQKCQMLESLSMTFCCSLRDKHLTLLEDKSRLPNLKYLNLEACERVSREAVEKLAKERSLEVRLLVTF